MFYICNVHFITVLNFLAFKKPHATVKTFKTDQTGIGDKSQIFEVFRISRFNPIIIKLYTILLITQKIK